MSILFMILGGLCSLTAFVCYILILIEAFKDEVWKGLLMLLTCQFYAIYYALVDFDHEYKWQIIGGWAGGALLAPVFYHLAYPGI